MIASLDIDDVRAFVTTAEQASFTRAAVLLDTSQSRVSMRIRRLETALGRRLLERTPRQVRASPDGARFLAPARGLLASHDAARGALEAMRARLTIGISHHAVGDALPARLRSIADAQAELLLDVRIASNRDILERYDAGDLDAVYAPSIGADRRDGIVIGSSRFLWAASPDFRLDRSQVPLVTQPAPCTVRSLVVDALEGAGIAWTEAFVGGGAATIGAATTAGLGVAALLRHTVPVGSTDSGARLQLPALPDVDLVLHSRTADGGVRGRLIDIGRLLFR